jgi:hypothetical protein
MKMIVTILISINSIFYFQTDITASNIKSYQENDDDLDNVKRFVLPPLTLVSFSCFPSLHKHSN